MMFYRYMHLAKVIAVAVTRKVLFMATTCIIGAGTVLQYPGYKTQCVECCGLRYRSVAIEQESEVGL